MRPIFCSLLLLASGVRAGSLTSVCAVINGGAGDTDGAADGQIALTCTLANGSFTGVVRESRDDAENYILGIQGVFLGSGSFDITGQFTLFGLGDFYPYIIFGGQLTGAGTVMGTEWLRLGGLATATPGPLPGSALPAAMQGSNGNLVVQPFNGLTHFATTVEWNAAGAGRGFDYSTGGLVLQYSTDPTRVIPEPATGGMLAAAVCVAAAVRRWRDQLK